MLTQYPFYERLAQGIRRPIVIAALLAMTVLLMAACVAPAAAPAPAEAPTAEAAPTEAPVEEAAPTEASTEAPAEEAPTAGDAEGNIVTVVQNAPIVADGNVADQKTDVVIDFDISMNPNEAGRTLLAGKSIRITLPEAFVNSEELPVAGFGSSETCRPGALQCNTAILLQGWPQHPVAPPKYAVSAEGTNTIVVTAREDILPATPNEPGIKSVHLVLLSVTNPEPGDYELDVVAETGVDGAVEQGTAHLTIHDRPQPSINVTSVMNEGTPNTIYQTTKPGEVTPLAYDFLLWDWDGAPLTDVTIAEAGENQWSLVQGERVVGTVDVQAPEGATGQRVYADSASVAFNSPVLSIPTAHLRAFFQAGSAAGEYVVTFQLTDGNSIPMTVQVSE